MHFGGYLIDRGVRRTLVRAGGSMSAFGSFSYFDFNFGFLFLFSLTGYFSRLRTPGGLIDHIDGPEK